MTLVLVTLGTGMALSTLFALLLGPAHHTSGSSPSTAEAQREADGADRVPALGAVR